MSESGNKASPSSKTRWHLLLGAVLDPLLKPVGIEVFVVSLSNHKDHLTGSGRTEGNLT